MTTPQQPELARSRRTPSQDPDSAAAVIEGSRQLADEGTPGNVPPDNRPGHHPVDEQDKPDLDAFAERLGTAAPGTAAPPAAPAGEADGRRVLAPPGAGVGRWRLAALLGAAAAFLLRRRAVRRRAA